MVGEKLHGDDSEDSLQGVNSLGDLQGVLGPLGSLCVALLDDDDGLAISSSHLNSIDYSYLQLVPREALPAGARSCTW